MKNINLFVLGLLLTGCNGTSSSIKVKNDPIVVDIYAFNDLHGRISEDNKESEPGISKISTFLKNQKVKNENTIIINSGDYWQDTYESGYNKGKLLSECLDEMGVDTFTLGNHEFDWGIDVIKENKKLSTYTTYLGANIVNYQTNEIVDYVEPYKIIEKDDVRIGVVGAIGRRQLTSITSSNWEDITFLDHRDIVKDLSDELRVEKKCDVVILSIHADEEDAYPNDISEVSPVSNEKYFDAVFCAHSHQKEVKYYNNVPFVQAGSHGNYLGHVTIEIDKKCDWEEENLRVAIDKGYADVNNIYANVSREEVCVILSNLVELNMDIPYAISFSDSSDVSNWAYRAVSAFNYYDIISGYKEKKYVYRKNNLYKI